MIKSFEDLDIYKRSKELFQLIIQVTAKFPSKYQFLSNQSRRAANSISANIAEGFGRSEAEFKKFLTSSLGSNNEIISHLKDALIACVIDDKVYQEIVEQYTILGKQIYRLKEKWKKF